jgi:hypothetical protein
MPIPHSGETAIRRVLLALLALLSAVLLSAVLLGAGPFATSAQAQAPASHRVAVAHSRAQSPGCVGLTRVPSSPVAWVDNHDERSPLVRNIARLICSAADHSTIDIKSWFITDDDPTVDALVTDLRMMHAQRDVRVNLLVGRDVYRTNHWSWAAFTRAFSFAHVSACLRECGNNSPGTVPHGKWMTVSALRGGGPAVLSTSTNWSHEQFRSAQSGILIAGDTRIYRSFIARWKSFQPCLDGAACTVTSNARWVNGGHRTSVYFAPIADDLTADTLSGVDCSNGGSISVLSLFLHRHPVEKQLLRLQSEGCHIRIVLEHAPPARISGEFPVRCEHQHDKAMVIDVPHQRLVIAGSEALTTHALTVNENQTLRTSVPSVVSTYRRYLDAQWREGGTCSRG